MVVQFAGHASSFFVLNEQQTPGEVPQTYLRPFSIQDLSFQCRSAFFNFQLQLLVEATSRNHETSRLAADCLQLSDDLEGTPNTILSAASPATR